MKKIFFTAFSLIFSVFFVFTTNAQISVSLPDTVIDKVNSDYPIEINISNIGQDSVSGFTFVIEFDPNKIEISGYTKTILSNNFFIQDNNQDSGKYRITAAGSTPIKYNGVIVILNASAIDTGKTDLHFLNATVNEGDPEVNSEDGTLIIWSYDYPPKPLSPKNGALNQNTSVLLSWGLNPLYELYEVQFSENEDFNPVLTYSNLSETSQMINDLKFNTTYYWRVRAYSSLESSPFSATNSFSTSDKSNTKPVISSSVPDLFLKEDFERIDIAFLDTVITDSETKTLNYEITSSNLHSSTIIQGRNLFIQSKKNEFGVDTIIIKGIDEGGLSISDTVEVNIQPVNDSPLLIQSFPDTLIFSTKETIKIDYSQYFTDIEDEVSELTLSFSLNPINAVLIQVEGSIISLESIDNYTGFVDINVEVTDTDNGKLNFNFTLDIEMSTSNESDPIVPKNLILHQNYPNPFNPSTNITYQLPEASDVNISVFDITGRLIQTLQNGRKAAGSYSLNFQASNLSSGVYFYRIIAGGFVQTRRMLLVK